MVLTTLSPSPFPLPLPFHNVGTRLALLKKKMKKRESSNAAAGAASTSTFTADTDTGANTDVARAPASAAAPVPGVMDSNGNLCLNGEYSGSDAVHGGGGKFSLNFRKNRRDSEGVILPAGVCMHVSCVSCVRFAACVVLTPLSPSPSPSAERGGTQGTQAQRRRG